MNKKARIVELVLIVLCCAGLAACAPDPRSQADADAIRLQAAQNAADQEAKRQQDAQKFALQQRESEAASAAWISFLIWSYRVATIAMGVTLLGVGFGASVAAFGMGRAVAQVAAVRANLIPLDKNTGQFPMVRYDGNGFVTLTDMNTGATVQLDTRNPAVAQMIAGANAVRLSGIVSYNASRHAKDPAGVAEVGVQPVVIGAAVQIQDEIEGSTNHG